MGFWSVCLLPIFILVRVETVPPEACFANFNWNDCGKSPEPVMYYWKPGSRCEVGLWRGCLPNLNMFSDEYECVTTCIFATRALPEDYHSIIDNSIDGLTEDEMEVTTESSGTETATNGGTEGGNSTGTEAVTVATGGGATDAGGDGNATVAGDKATTGAGRDASATTAATA